MVVTTLLWTKPCYPDTFVDHHTRDIRENHTATVLYSGYGTIGQDLFATVESLRHCD
jgi:hypothetical protein